MVTTRDSLMRAIMTLYGNEVPPRHRGDEARRPTTGADDASTGSFKPPRWATTPTRNRLHGVS
ncbi:MAG: hypothetical protein ACLU7P_06680 [Eggerthella lenta]